jgi:hypothetical protein
MWEPRRLTTLWASTACYRDRFIFFVDYMSDFTDDRVGDNKDYEYYARAYRITIITSMERSPCLEAVSHSVVQEISHLP